LDVYSAKLLLDSLGRIESAPSSPLMSSRLVQTKCLFRARPKVLQHQNRCTLIPVACSSFFPDSLSSSWNRS